MEKWRETALVTRALILLSLLVLVAWWGLVNPTISNLENNELQVTFLDVNQGDAIYLKTPDGIEVLIDGGPNRAVLRELRTFRSAFDRTLDLVIATHPDQDHVGGLVDVFEAYEVASILQTDLVGESAAAVAYEATAEKETTARYQARAGDVIKLGASTSLSVLFPTASARNLDSNTASVVLKLSYGEVDFMLTGDAPQLVERFLVERHGAALRSEVLKVGHHGSKTSTAPEFLAAVAPAYAVISAGQDNRYGHPHQEVVERLLEAEINIFSTAELGSVTFFTDGQEVWPVE